MKRGRPQHNEDKLSDLPDCLLVRILSLLNVKEAVQTCLLSKRWKHLWKYFQKLFLTETHFGTLEGFANFVDRILSLRDASTTLITLVLHTLFQVETHLLETVETFVASQQNLKRLGLFCDIQRVPQFLFSGHTLESLTLKCEMHANVVFPDSLNLPALTYLDLWYVVFCSGDDGRAKPFSAFNMLNTLIIRQYKHLEDAQRDPEDAKTLCISNTMLVNLVIDTGSEFLKIELSAPSLCTFTFDRNPYQQLFGSSLSCVKQVSIGGYIAHSYRIGGSNEPFYHAHMLLNWLIKLVNIKSLTISANTLQVLSLIPDLLKCKLTSWCNLKSLKIGLYPHGGILSMRRNRDVSYELASGKPWKENTKLREAIKTLEPYACIPDGVIDFLIQNSPSAKVEILIPKQ